MIATPNTKAALEELLRQRRLAPEEPPLRGERRRGPLSIGSLELDARMGGGLPRGQLSEAFGPASSGRTGLALATAARVTGTGGLLAWVDPQDRFDPASAAAAGVDLDRLLWLRGIAGDPRAIGDSTRAVATLLESGLFDLVVLDLAGVSAQEHRRLPGPTWIRLQRAVEAQESVLLLLAAQHVAKGPRGFSLSFTPCDARFAGEGTGRLFVSLRTEVRPGPLTPKGQVLELPAPAMDKGQVASERSFRFPYTAVRPDTRVAKPEPFVCHGKHDSLAQA